MIRFIEKNGSIAKSLGPEWVIKSNAKHLGEIVDKDGQLATDYTGREWRIVTKKVYCFTANEQGVRRFLAVLALIFSIGLAYFSKSIKDLLFKKKESHYIATPLQDSLFGMSFLGRTSKTLNSGKYLPFVDDAQKVSLLDFRKASPIEQNEAIKIFQLFNAIASMGGQNFLDKVNGASEELLQKYSLFDVQTAHVSPLKYALMTDEELLDMTVGGLYTLLLTTGEALSSQQGAYLSACLQTLAEHLDLADEIPENFSDMRLVQLLSLSGAQIQQHFADMPDVAFSFLTPKQVAELDFSQMSKEQLAILLPHQATVFTPTTGRYLIESAVEARFASLTAAQQQAILDKLPGLACQLLTDQILALDFEQLTKEQLAKLIPGQKLGSESQEDFGRRATVLISKFKISQLQAIYNKLLPEVAVLIPLDKLGDLDLSEATEQDFAALVYGRDPRVFFSRSAAVRLAAILSTSIQHVFAYLNSNELDRLTSDQLVGLDFSSLDPELVKKQFGALYFRLHDLDFSAKQILDLVTIGVELHSFWRLSSEKCKQLRAMPLTDEQKALLSQIKGGWTA